MPKFCERCRGTGHLWREPKNQTPQQRANRLGDGPAASWVVRCSDCRGRGVKGRMLRSPTSPHP